MQHIARALVLLIALEHVWILILEMFLWTTPRGMATFGTTPEFAASSAVLAANQGLYNGFLAAGLFWAAFARQNAFSLRAFFLGCVVVAGIYGGLTAKTSILMVQGLPALIALVVCIIAHRSAAARG